MNIKQDHLIKNEYPNKEKIQKAECPFSTEPCSQLEKQNGEIFHLREELAILEAKNKQLETENSQLKKENQENDANLNKLSNMLFGRSSEKKQSPADCKVNDQKTDTPTAESKDDQQTTSKTSTKRKRGAQHGQKGHGRTIPEDIKIKQIEIDLPEEDSCCSICGKSYSEVPFTEDSSILDIEATVYLRVEKRKRAKRQCDCEQDKPVIVTAPKKPQAIEKSKFSHSLIAYLIVLKYHFSIPLERILSILAIQGAEIASGSIVGVFKKLLPLLEPLYELLIEDSRNSGQWNIDETGWMNFINKPDKKGFLNWMWIFVSEKLAIYVFDPSRSSKVPFDFLGDDANGIVVCDRYSSYIKLAKLLPGIILAICWAHFRRDFLNAALKYKILQSWADLWVERIGEIYHLNKERLKVSNDHRLFVLAQRKLEKAISDMKKDIETELKDPSLHDEQVAVLKRALKFWDSLTVFVDNPRVPMDNNIAERGLRSVVIGRKNYYGTYASWSAHFSAICMSLLQTANLNGLNPIQYIRYYLDACAEAGGVPSNLEKFHPKNLSNDIIDPNQ